MRADPFDDPTRPPPLRLLLAESRVAWEALRFVRGSRRTGHLPRGDGHAVLLIPGFGADERWLRLLRSALVRLGYRAEDWGLGRNLGMRRAIGNALGEKLGSMASSSGRKVSIIGWSLGGVFARELARSMPDRVREVITLGSPINRRPDANNMMTLFRLANGGRAPRIDREGFERRRIAPPVPCTAIYSREDGIVAWEACLEAPAPNTRNVEVRGSHSGLVFNLGVLEVVARVLAHSTSEKLSDGR
jgi:pimeloyl-ACP methyl ester carboxylesterase